MAPDTARGAPARTRTVSQVGPGAAGAAAAGLAVAAVLLLLVQTGWGPLRRLDDGTLSLLHEAALASAALVLVADGVSLLGSTAAYVVVLGALVAWLWRRGDRREAVFVGGAVVGGRLLNALAKGAVDRPRPELADPVGDAASSAFPSGHAQGVVVAAGVLVALGLRRRAVLVALAGWVLLVGAARVVLGVHAPSDVVAGWGLGLAWVTACTAVLAPSRVLAGAGRGAGT